MSESFRRFEGVSHHGSFAKSVRVGRRVVFVLGSNSTRRKFNIGKGRREETKACVLYKQSVEGSGRTIPINREVGFCIDNDFQEVKALLPSSCHQCHDRSSAQESNDKLEAAGQLI